MAAPQRAELSVRVVEAAADPQVAAALRPAVRRARAVLPAPPEQQFVVRARVKRTRAAAVVSAGAGRVLWTASRALAAEAALVRAATRVLRRAELGRVSRGVRACPSAPRA